MTTSTNLLHIRQVNHKVISGKINIVYININSLRYKLSDIETIISSLTQKNHVMHIIALTEIRINSYESNFFNITNYHSFFSHNSEKSGGVALYCLDSLNCHLVVDKLFQQMNFLCIHIANYNFKVGVFYRNPKVSSRVLTEFLDDILEHNKKMILLGDFNLDISKTNNQVMKYENMIHSNMFHIISSRDISFPTRIASRQGVRSASIIDHIITDACLFKYSIGLHDISFSDHKMITIGIDDIGDNNIQIGNSSDHHKFICPKEYRKKLSTFQLQLNEISNNSNTFLTSEYFSILNRCKAESTKRIPNCTNSNKKCWVTQELLSAINERDRYLTLKHKFPRSEFICSKYKEHKLRCEKIRKTLKNGYFSSLIRKNIDNRRKLWKTFNLIMRNAPLNYKAINSIKDNDGVELSDKSLITETFNTHFANIGSKLAADLQLRNNFRPVMKTNTFRNRHSMYIRNFTELEVSLVIQALKPNNNFGSDGISVNFIKNNTDILLSSLTKVINHIFQNGEFPDELKLARLTPVHKAGDKTCTNNYRPISNLPAIAKIAEKLLCSMLEEFASKHLLIHCHQYGFQKKSGTSSAVTQLLTFIQANMEKKLVTSSIFIDLTKAFDTISHSKILEKLEDMGLRGKARKLMKSYFRMRRQYVEIDKFCSDPTSIDYGIPQGSTLGPLLFILFINDIFNVQFRGKLILFADDAVLVYGENNVEDLFDAMQHDIILLEQWLYNNMLSLNSDKTKYLIFRTKNKNIDSSHHTIHSNGKIINEVTHIKYLGLIVDNGLSFIPHANQIKRKMAALTGVMGRLKRCVPINLMSSIYYAHIHSQFAYLFSSWGNMINSTTLQDIQVLQNKAIRHIYHVEYFIENKHTADILRDHRIMNITQQLKFNTAVLMYKIQNQLIKNSFILVRNMEIHNYLTRNRNDLHINRTRLSSSMNNILYKGAIIFNNISSNLKNVPSIVIFKKELKKEILQSSST